VLRTEKNITPEVRKKIALFCNVAPEAVIQSIDMPSIYKVPVSMHEQHLEEIVLRKTEVPQPWGEPHMTPWLNFLDAMDAAKETVSIGLVGKYVELQDAYKSINEALFQSATYNNHKLNLVYIHSEKLDDSNVAEKLKDMDGVIIAPGFGNRGIEGKFVALKWCRENNVPTFGICLGMQCMVIEFARNVLGYADANSTEMDAATKHNVIDLMEDQKSVTDKGGTMRLGAYDCVLREGSKAAKAYGTTHVSERHRHRFEFNDDFRARYEEAGMQCVGENPDTHLVEVVELPEKRWFIGTQYHPEYSSTVLHPHPLFLSFVKAAIAYQADKKA
jgi:CTP synthase